MPRVYIDGTEYEARENTNMLEVALENGLDLPYFCWHPAMGSVGSCRLCAVKVFKDENDTTGKIQMACMTPAVDGTRMSMSDPEAAEFRRYVIEWLMTNHPHDCPVCDEGGECHLQDMTVMCGQVYRRYRHRKRTYRNQYLGPLVNHEMNRCIQCYRCTRFYRDLAGGRDLNVFGSKNRIYFGRHEDGVLESEFSGNLVEVCPTGVFTDKTLAKHYTRKWDLETAPSVCIHCGIGCNTIPGARYAELRRIRARYNRKVNGYFLCDRGRYGYDFVNSELRLRSPRLKGGEDTDLDGAIASAKDALNSAKGVVGIGSPISSLEANFALKKLVGEGNYSTGLSKFEHEGVELALRVLREGLARTPSLSEVELADVIFIVGADPTNEAPMLDFAIRQAMRKAPLDIARRIRIPDWDANAVANALQDAKGKLYIATPWAVKLDEIALETQRLSLEDSAKLAGRIGDRINAADYDGDDITVHAAADLKDAHKPLVVTSISAGPNAIKAATNLARTLYERGKDCWLFIIVPEANTMGVGMIAGMSVDEALGRLESGEADTLVVLENDLSRRVRPDVLESAVTRAAKVISIDFLQNPTSDSADILFASAAYVETDGTFVNNEGRAQRFYQVFIPKGEMPPAWLVLRDLMPTGVGWRIYEDVLRDLAWEMPIFEGALRASESAGWRDHAGRKVPRMTHRFSGRTSKDADKSVYEPRTPDDPATPFAFSMEGDHNPQPGPLVPRLWAPGWNSENAINKFQIEINGPLHDENPGVRLIEQDNGDAGPLELDILECADDSVQVLLRPRIFGSDGLSMLSSWIAELAPPAELAMSDELASALGLETGQIAEIDIDGLVKRLPVRVDNGIAGGLAIAPAHYPDTKGITGPVSAKIRRAQ